MAGTYRSDDWDCYRVDYHDPFAELEPPEREQAVVGEALQALCDAGVIAHTAYDEARFLAHRSAVRERFEVPWTAIAPRMERLIWALNAIAQPQVMVAAGVFCGFTFISNAGAAVGPGACYTARELVGIEIKPEEAARAERNVRRLDPTSVARVVAADAVTFVAQMAGPVDLLYLDADGDAARGKGIYHDILQACYDRLPAGALVLAHNSVNCAARLEHYLAFVRDAAHFRASVNVVFDPEGLEVSVK